MGQIEIPKKLKQIPPPPKKKQNKLGDDSSLKEIKEF